MKMKLVEVFEKHRPVKPVPNITWTHVIVIISVALLIAVGLSLWMLNQGL